MIRYESQSIFEKIFYWCQYAYGIKFVSLRYFNAAGASEHYGEDHDPETHLIPNVIKVALGQRDYVPVFGTDYNTKDGSCVRDYIHVLDIAKAHIIALKHLQSHEGGKVYNLGNGEGYSVMEVIRAVQRITGRHIPTVVRARREGGPPILVASSDLAKSELGWQPTYPDLESIVESAWRWQKSHPNGYSESR